MEGVGWGCDKTNENFFSIYWKIMSRCHPLLCVTHLSSAV